jgi:hypothetical protein
MQPVVAPVNETVRWFAIGLQAGGILLTLAGVFVVRSWLDAATGATVAAGRSVGRSVGRWVGLRMEAARRLIARLRGKPITVRIEAAEEVSVADRATVSKIRSRVDRATVSDRDWLRYLDDQVDSLHTAVDQIARQQSAERERTDERLASRAKELRGEILRTARDGWQLIVFGLALSFAGTVLSGFA